MNKLLIENLNTSQYTFKKRKDNIFDVLPISNSNNNISIHHLSNVRLLAEEKFYEIFLLLSKYCKTNQCPLSCTTHLYLDLEYHHNNWSFVCEKQTELVGLCSYPIPHFLTQKLSKAIKDCNKLFRERHCLAIHVNLSLKVGLVETVHANTLIIDKLKRKCWLFDPQGKLNMTNIPNISQLHRTIHSMMLLIGNKNNYRYLGYFTPTLNCQRDDHELCFLWTSWVELLVLINFNLKPSNLQSHLVSQLQSNYNNKDFILGFHHYLQDFLKSI
jgi:hypothetical protein